MGLVEQIQSGSVFLRGEVRLTNTPTAIGNSGKAFGSSYILLGAYANQSCRLRLYGDENSATIDSPRTTSSFSYSASVALNLDMEFTPGTQSIEFVPPILATTYNSGSTWYNIEGAPGTEVVVSYYPIEFNTGSRTSINVPDYPGVNLSGFQTSSGNIPSPKSFIIIGALCDTTDIRLRLYSRPIEDISVSEMNRIFLSQSATNSHLISDMIFDSASYFYVVSPTLQGYNLEDYFNANNRLGYIIENLSASPKTGVYAGIRMYPVEE